MGRDLKTKDFVVHGSFPTTRSEFFRRVLNGNWQEAGTRVTNLPDDDPDIVTLYVNFIYTGQLPTAAKDDKEFRELATSECCDYIMAEYRTLFHIYVFAEKLQDVSAKNGVTKAVWKLSSVKSKEGAWHAVPLDAVKLVYQRTPLNSLARSLVVHIWNTHSFDQLLQRAKDMDKDFREDLGQFTSKYYKPLLWNTAAKDALEK